ncbi:YggL family protein [Thiopseudomonas acetoxidans]|uniref:50S ribosome-binding protein YggL n=1 Tax=Thiopseudomonas acetoxidans TaxID=3041622 RepID=A0ABT7SMC3_9GAMM|nr:50S ribosome-binding protein YggL [Thiopseudomonas sp. CY1220]MDM7857331.1 50S ribosome-binding protein YggL [Thiopseudomonas sp. CY1220]NLC10418.1 DUF469 family protein [Gammaproteobacteria bacterium]
MAKNRSRRLRKKLCVDEFQELGFEVQLEYPEDTTDETVEAFFSDFIVQAIEANGLALIGGPEYSLVCLAKRGSVSEEQRAAVEGWLKARKEHSSCTVSPLLDAWYPGNAIA